MPDLLLSGIVLPGGRSGRPNGWFSAWPECDMLMANDYGLVPIRSAELSVGKPIPWSVYDAAGNFLLVKGFILESQNQLETLRRIGYKRDYHRADSGRNALVSSRKREDEEKDGEASSIANITRMDRMKWVVGESIELQPIEAQEARYNVRLVGFVSNKSVIITAPMAKDKLAFVREGHAFVARSFFGKHAYAFSSSVLKVVHSPYSYLHLSYPQNVRLAEIRKGARAKVNDDASVALADTKKTQKITLVDLSIGGASGVAPHALGETNQTGQIAFQIHVADIHHAINLKFVLRSITVMENGEGYRHGFEFLELTPQDRLVLSAYVHQILAEAAPCA